MTRADFESAALASYLAARFGPGELALERVGGGQSNPTYFVAFAGRRMVLRKQPSGPILRGAHAVDREFRVLSALADTNVPVPRPILFEPDPSTLGTPFYLMERVEGRVFHDAALPGLDPAERRAVYLAMAETLAALHSLQPEAIGLGDYGRPGNYFERQLARINQARSELARYQRTLVTVPIRKPIVGEVDMTSPFGARMDPFLRGPAIHTGIDLRGHKGDPVRVTAAGKVVTASWQGGYGNMIEVDHGNGLSTRYGHLSAIEVKVGQHVAPGQTIGRIGSTGRSTGPHLHYETRVDDVAVNPQKFLRAGVRLGNS